MVVIAPAAESISKSADSKGPMEVRTLTTSVSALSFSDEKAEPGYIFNAATDLLNPSKLHSADNSSRSAVDLPADSKENCQDLLRPSFEAPDPTIAAAFLAKAGSSTGASIIGPNSINPVTSSDGSAPNIVMAAPGIEALLPDLQVLERFTTDLIPYYLCQFELEGIAVTAHPIPKDLPEEARKAAKATAVSAIPEFETLAIAVMKQARPSLSGMEDTDIKLEMRSMAEVLQLACEARMTDGRTEVPLSELMYDDAFVHGLVNFQQQPSKQLLDMLKWLFDEVNALHQKGVAHGSISLSSVMCHPEEGWKLLHPEQPADIKTHQQQDVVSVARAMCFMCLSSDHRRKYQPHHLADLKDDELLGLVANVPDVCMLASAMFSGRASLAKALDFHLWHPLAVHAQVMLDTKAVMRSMRLGSEDFDRNYNVLVLGGRSWQDVLGTSLIPDVIVASRQHVLRSDFAAYAFDSAASLLRFTANTIGHFEELKLGLQLSKVAFLDAILALFPALVPVCYHYLAAYPSLHVRNRDSELVFGAIEGDVDATHRIMHTALSGYASDAVWDLASLPEFTPKSAGKDPKSQLGEDFAKWQCKDMDSCDGSACIFWHDERELRFAKEHLCKDFMEGDCKRSACPNAHGFAEIRDAMNDASPICWRWLEGRCRVPHCKYAHTFRRHHASQRISIDGSRSSFSRPRSSFDGRRRRSNVSDAGLRMSNDRRRTSIASAADANRLDGPAPSRLGTSQGLTALDSALTRQAKLPIKPIPARKSMEFARASVDGGSRPWANHSRTGSMGGSAGGSASGDENGSSKSMGNRGNRNNGGATWGEQKSRRSGTFHRPAEHYDAEK
eukprot:jgi/Ulvmu1/10976/UM007_0155.1